MKSTILSRTNIVLIANYKTGLYCCLLDSLLL